MGQPVAEKVEGAKQVCSNGSFYNITNFRQFDALNNNVILVTVDIRVGERQAVTRQAVINSILLLAVEDLV